MPWRTAPKRGSRLDSLPPTATVRQGLRDDSVAGPLAIDGYGCDQRKLLPSTEVNTFIYERF